MGIIIPSPVKQTGRFRVKKFCTIYIIALCARGGLNARKAIIPVYVVAIEADIQDISLVQNQVERRIVVAEITV